MTYSTASTIGRTIQSLTNSYELVDEFKPGTPKHLSYSESVKYCERCKGLDECQYGVGGRGYQALQEQYTFGSDAIEYTVYTKCRYLLEHEAKARKKRLFDESGLPARHKAVLIQDLSLSAKAKRQCGALVVGKITGLKLSEAQAAIAIGNELIARGRGVKYVTSSELVTALRYDNPEYQKNLQSYLTIETLIIASVGSERYSEYNEEQLSMVIEGRQRRARRTVVVVTRQRDEYESLREELAELETIEDQVSE